MASWVQQLLNYHDTSKDGKLSVSELVNCLRPSVGNTYDCTAAGPCKKATMTQEHSLEIGKRNASVYIAMLIKCVPTALKDNLIDIHELRANATCSQIDQLYQVENGSIIVDENGFGIPTQEGALLLERARQYL